MIPLLQDKVEKEYGWLTAEETIDCIAVSQGLPGVIAINMATYTGYYKKGLKGALCATAGMILPSLVIILVISAFLTNFQENYIVQGALTGIRAAATGLVAYAALRLGKQIIKGCFQAVLAVASFLLIAVFGVNAVWCILAGIIIGIAYTVMKTGKAVEDVKAQNAGGEKK